MIDFQDRVALVVGGTAGIGEAVALGFAARGANVVIGGLGEEQGEAVAAACRAHGVEAAFLHTDVLEASQVERLVAHAVARFGRIDAAVNNAGIEGRFGPVQDASLDDFERIIGVNLRGIWLGMKYQVPQMLLQGGGAIVNTSSSAGITGIANVALYTASKHAVVGLTKASALELARANIRVNAVAPGPVDTGLLQRMIAGQIDIGVIAESVPMGRVSAPRESAQAILWLCSDAASYVTGHTLVVDGGLTVG